MRTTQLLTTVAFASVTLCAVAQVPSSTSRASFDACVAAKVAANPGKMTAEAQARKACREQFPASVEELDELRQKGLLKPVAGTGPALTTGGPAAATPALAPTGATATPGTSTTPVTVPAPIAAPSPVPAPVPVPVPAPVLPPVGGPGGSPGGPKH
jgi:hypothetical protein